MIGFQMVLTCGSREAEDEFWNEMQDNMAELESDIAYAIRAFLSETVYRGTPLHLVPGWEVKLTVVEEEK